MKAETNNRQFPRRKKFTEKQGFTLLEVLIAMATLTVGLLAVGAMQVSSIRGNLMSGNTSIALSLAGERIEDLMNRNIHDSLLADLSPANNSNLASIASVDFEERLNGRGQVVAGGLYRRIWNIADDTPTISLKTITVIVTWENNKHRVALTCIKQP